MRQTSLPRLLALFTCFALAPAVLADRVELNDGSVLNGSVVSAADGTLLFKTSFAGTVVITQTEIRSLATDQAVNVRLPTGSIVQGRISPAAPGVKVEGPNVSLTAAPVDISALWLVGTESPTERFAREAAAKAARKWAYEASVAITGRTGASEKFNSAFGFKATLASAHDKLILAAAAEYADDNGVKTADRQFAGVDYSSFYSIDNGWYARTSLEKDEIKGIDLRSLSAFGFGRKLIKKDHQDLEFRLGVSYLHETYVTGPDFKSPGLDITLLHSYKFAFAKLNSVLAYTPAFENFGNYRVSHESSLEMPLAASLWKLRLGLSNQFQSMPPAGVEKMDTTYFTSLILNWE